MVQRSDVNCLCMAPLAPHAAALASKGRGLVPPEVAEAMGRQGGVTHGRLNVAVAEIRLDGAGVVSVIGELVTAAVAQHVAVDQESELGGNPGPGHHPLIAGDAQRRAPLGYKDVGRACQWIPLQTPQRPAFLRADRMDCINPALGPPDIQAASL